jgi:hypothetical protein
MVRTLGIAGLLLATSTLIAQDRTSYKSRHEISWPVPSAIFSLSPKPAKFRLYTATDGGRFELATERTLDELQKLRDRREGFLYTAKGDGVEDFAVQLVYPNGDVEPAKDRLRADYRIVFDTRPPSVTAASEGRSTVVWTMQDENLDVDATRLECRWLNGDPSWTVVPKPRGGFAAKDRYTWQGLTQDTRTLEVRVVGKDKAGHESTSRIVRLGNGVSGSGGLGAGLGGSAIEEFTPRAMPSGRLREDVNGELPGQPKILYMDKKTLEINSKLNTVTRSGVKKVYLFAKDLTRDPNGEWKLASEQVVDIKYQATSPAVKIPYLAPDDGRFGFIVIPESGAGNREPNPRSTAPPQHLVEVDTKSPEVTITQVTPMPGGSTGTKVEIQWDAKDANLIADQPILIEYAESKTSKDWTSIAERLPNSRRYVWEVPQNTPYKFFIRVRATDRATNVGEKITEKEVIVDLDKPSATIEDVRTSGSISPAAATVPANVPASTPTSEPITKPTPPQQTVVQPMGTPTGGPKAPDPIRDQK